MFKRIQKLFSKKYNPETYWKSRHSLFGFDLRGAGNKALSLQENKVLYEAGKTVFEELLYSLGISIKGSRILEVGCGSGFYTSFIRELGGSDYTGLDITDVLFSQLTNSYPGFRFMKSDISTNALDSNYELIIMIDVTQHITEDDKFSFAMKNIREHLEPGGIFLVTSWLDDNARNLLHEKSRSLSAYKKFFPTDEFTPPRSFRDKYIFAIIKKQDASG